MSAARSKDLSAFLFPSTRKGIPVTPANYLWRVLKPLAKRAEVADVTFQSLRRTSDTGVGKHCENAQDAKGHMRHSSLATTFDYYVQPIPESIQAAQLAWEQELNARVN